MTMQHENALCHAQEKLRLRELDAALRGFAAAEALGADLDQCSAGRWLIHMLRGDLTSAWAESDAIRARGTSDAHRFWQGEDLRGKHLILRCLHGLGDAVQFLRYVPALRSQAESLVIEVPPALLPIATCFAGVQQVITWGDGAPLIPPRWDMQIEVNELPYLFRTTEEQLPLATSYLQLPSSSAIDLAPELSKPSNLRVGVVWASGSWNPSRSLAFELLRPIFSCADCEFWNLQGGSEREQWSELAPGPHLHDGEASASSLLGLAATIAQLDLVITSDTLAAHLAGALGISAWVMLERVADWRWQHLREDSPWYPTLRLFRQHREGDWTGVIANLVRELHLVSIRRMVA